MPHRRFPSLSAVFARARQRPRLVAAGCGALVVLVVAVSLLGITILQPQAAPTGAPLAAASTATGTLAASPTLTNVPPTHTPNTHAPANNPVHAPPPPPVPTPPAATPPITFCPTPTPLPAPTATPVPPTATPTSPASPTATPTSTGTPTASQSQAAAMSATCTPCPYYKGNNPSQSQIRAALYQAADQYGLPRNLLLADAWQESKWHEDVTSCDGGIGLMQIQYYTYPWLNGVSVPQCGLSPTSYDPYDLQGNADLGAKFFVWLSCFYSYWGDDGGTSPSNPGADTIAWYYQQAHLNYPDTNNPKSYCAAVFNNPNNTYYAALPSTTSGVWSCPYNASTAEAYCPSYDTNGQPSLLDITLSAYNEGPGYTDQYGIQNCWYVDSVESYIPQFASGALP